MTDMINPDHYKGDRKFEPIEVIEDWGLNYRLGNALKYISRNGRKPGEDAREGLKKAIWYLEREIQSQTAQPAYPAPDYDEVYEFFLENEVPFDATGNIDLWDDSLGPQEPMDGAGNPVYAGDYKGPLYAPHPAGQGDSSHCSTLATPNGTALATKASVTWISSKRTRSSASSSAAA